MTQEQDKFEMEGKVTELIPGGGYVVVLKNGFRITTHLGGKLVKNSIKLNLNDLVTVEISKYDVTKGIIIYRGKKPVYTPYPTNNNNNNYKPNNNYKKR